MMSSIDASKTLLAAAAKVKLAVFDVDGVLTDGGLLYSAEGETLKRFDVRDGLAFRLLEAAGIEVAVITARESAPLARRLKDLGVRHFFPGCSAKLSTLNKLITRLQIQLSEVAYTGDDLVDLPALRAVGCPVAVQNAHELLKREALWTTSRCGGDGAAREIAEFLIGAQREFEPFVADYLKGRTAPPASLSFAVVIPARYASSRLPGKPLIRIAGKPMIEHVCQNALKAGATDVVVATDDRRIYEVVEQFGGRAVMTSPDHVSGTDRIAEVAAQCGWPDAQIVVNLQGDEPLLDVALVQKVAALLKALPQAGIATLATPITEPKDLFDPNVVKVVVEHSGLAQYFSRAPIPWVRDAFGERSLEEGRELPKGVPFLRHLGLYAYRVATLKALAASEKGVYEEAESLEQLRALGLGIRIAVATIDEAPGHGVDTPADLARVEADFARRAASAEKATHGEPS